jgi:DNA modification methylase
MAAAGIALDSPRTPALRVQWLPIGLLRPNPKNPRTHSRRQIRQLAATIRKLGFINPVIVDGDRMILAGHGRVEAARLAGLTEVPVIQLDHLTAAQRRAYLISDNRIAEQAGWDRELLAIELGELMDLLPAEGLDISLTGFETSEIDLLLSDMASPPQAPEDMLPTLATTNEAVTQRGDLWLCGKHRLLCGDARQPRDFARLMNGTRAAAVFTDPPYNLRVRSIGGRGKNRHPEFAFASGEMLPGQYRAFLTQTLGNGVRVSSDGAVHFVCMDWRHIADLIEVGCGGLYGEMLNLAVWNKSNAGQGSFYRSQHELICVFRVGDQAHRNNVELGRFGRNRSNVWTYAGVNSFGSDRDETLATHPTVKPVALVADALLDCTARGDVVLDQFAGSGTQLLAAEKVGRIAYAMEFEARYVDAGVLRWQRLTKRDAILAGDGRTFEEINAVRRKKHENFQQPRADSIYEPLPRKPRKAAINRAGGVQRRAVARKKKHGNA